MTKKWTFGVLFAAAAVMLVFIVGVTKSRSVRFEQIVEFTYSRTRPCNTDYYNYSYSIGPLNDLLMYWNSENGASRTGFRTKVKRCFVELPGFPALNLSQDDADDLCQNAASQVLKCEGNSHPIKCRMIVSGENVEVVKLLVQAYKETILKEIELENLSMSWKATMDRGLDLKKKEKELGKLRKTLGVPCVDAAAVKSQNEALAAAEQETRRAKYEWERAIRAYREKWDALVVFKD